MNDDVIIRAGVDPARVIGKPPPPPLARERQVLGDVVREKDLAVRLRDGSLLYVDAYLPRELTGPLPALLAWGPYGKHWQTDRMFPGADVDAGWISELTGFEAPDPAYWCAHGYAVVYADPRGLWHSEGTFPHNGPQERDDLYDAIEWIGAQEWCTGSVGMLGVSYLAGSQYQAAAAGPPALKAISPWECFSDWYREFGFHGGIPETGFRPRVAQNVSYSLSSTEDPDANMTARPLDGPYYSEKYGDLGAVDIPAYVVASWSDHGLHTRGTLRAYTQLGSPDKWLEVHGRKKWRHFYDPQSVERQREFFDTYLKYESGRMRDWPRVRLEIREGSDPSDWQWTSAEDWPLPERFDVLSLDLAADRLSADAVSRPSTHTFDPATESLQLTHTFTRDVDIIGPASLRLRLSVDDEATDADVFVALEKRSADGEAVHFPINALFADGPVALGWLRASHRALDAARSTPLVPWHPHLEEEPLIPGAPVDLEIELWPSATRYRAGETLVLTVQGRDVLHRPAAAGVPPLQILHQDLRNRGLWTVHSGPGIESVLRLPLQEVPS